MVINRKTKVLFFSTSPYDPEQFKTFMRDKLDISFYKPNTKQKIKDIEKTHIVIGDWFTKTMLRKAKNLKYFFIPYSGIPPKLIDILKEKKELIVSNTHYNADFVAEHAFSLMLTLARKTIYLDQCMRCDQIPHIKVKKTNLFSLREKKLAILGYGYIGRSIEKKAKVFGMKPLIYHKQKSICTDMLSNEKKQKKELKLILSKSDFIVVCLPLTEKTRGLIGENEFKLIKPSAYIINVSRGEIIQEKALYNALKNNTIAGAGIDTWYNYTTKISATKQLYNYPFNKLKNIVMSPHIAYRSDLLETCRTNSIKKYLTRVIMEKKVENIIDLKRGY
ncbi:hypothetical protein GF327_00405 [Candidatus Woesearchaeota archaeon]|nr:hypothetical protein [Candidatus Woesearchaeota archaeon]